MSRNENKSHAFCLQNGCICFFLVSFVVLTGIFLFAAHKYKKSKFLPPSDFYHFFNHEFGKRLPIRYPYQLIELNGEWRLGIWGKDNDVYSLYASFTNGILGTRHDIQKFCVFDDRMLAKVEVTEKYETVRTSFCEFVFATTNTHWLSTTDLCRLGYIQETDGIVHLPSVSDQYNHYRNTHQFYSLGIDIETEKTRQLFESAASKLKEIYSKDMNNEMNFLFTKFLDEQSDLWKGARMILLPTSLQIVWRGEDGVWDSPDDICGELELSFPFKYSIKGAK